MALAWSWLMRCVCSTINEMSNGSRHKIGSFLIYFVATATRLHLHLSSHIRYAVQSLSQFFSIFSGKWLVYWSGSSRVFCTINPGGQLTSSVWPQFIFFWHSMSEYIVIVMRIVVVVQVSLAAIPFFRYAKTYCKTHIFCPIKLIS